MTAPKPDMRMRRTPVKGNRVEYNFYYFVIFLAALPFCFAMWLRDLLTLNDASLKDSVISRGKREAANMTPWIFQR